MTYEPPRTPLLSRFHPYDEVVHVAHAQGAGTLALSPMMNAPRVTFDRAVIPVNVSHATNSTGTVSLTFSLGIFTRTASTLSLLASASQSYTLNVSGTASSSNIVGLRNATIPFSSSLREGNYYLGVWSRTSTAGANASMSVYAASQVNSSFSGLLGSASATSAQQRLGQGIYTVSFSTAMPTSVAFSHIRATGSAERRPTIVAFMSESA